MRAPAIALLLAAASLAGCTAPSLPQASGPAAAPQVGLAAASAVPQLHALPAALGSVAGLDAVAGDTVCASEPQRTEDHGARQVIIRVEGCSLLVDPLIFGGLPAEPRIEVDVGSGARAIDAQLHLHSGDHLLAALKDANSHTQAKGDDTGGSSRDSLVRLHVDSPAKGTWKLIGNLDDLSVAQGWTCVVVVTYA